jgi:HSP20 family molecular chaperone IbpA
VDAGKISAKYENGILYLTIPKKEHARKVSRAIEIQ